jgi:hypothetical protein
MVPVGTTTKVGYGATITTAIAAILAYLFADADAQTLGVIASGIFAAISMVTTQIGRYMQAKEIIKQDTAHVVASIAAGKVS